MQNKKVLRVLYVAVILTLTLNIGSVTWWWTNTTIRENIKHSNNIHIHETTDLEKQTKKLEKEFQDQLEKAEREIAIMEAILKVNDTPNKENNK